GQPRIEHWRIPRRRAGQRAAALRRLRTRRDPVGVAGRRLGACPSVAAAGDEGGGSGASPADPLEEVAAGHLTVGGNRTGHVGGHPDSPSGSTKSGAMTCEGKLRRGFTPQFPARSRVQATVPYGPPQSQPET